MNAVLANETLIRASAFASVFLLMLAAEALWPRRRLVMARAVRWPTNLAIIALGNLSVRILTMAPAPLAAAAVAVMVERHGVGVLQLMAAPTWAKVLIGVLLLDLAIWAQHVAFHRLAWLWLLHAVHHADRDIDVTTALRFHPLEILLSTLYKSVVVATFGAPLLAVIVFEIGLNACAMFNHANLHLPRSVDRIVRLVFVTPDLHRVHHSVHADEHNSNFGFCLSVWDRLFGAFREQPRDGHQGMTIGLNPYQDAAPGRLSWSLALPWRSDRT